MNTFALTASVAEISQQRYTPAGIPALDLLLSHESQQIEAGQSRKVTLSLKALALGTTAETLAKTEVGKQVKFKGFLASTKNGKGSVLHITDIEFI
ncbi:primosomal replication protein N [Variovorax sp. PCZ-1]|uniref:primosomal replication protein N n=1 Tax=Variovorax sp. PCZ-1 TaxID=2835533 RepID=UPI001BCDD14A|nr:primosomal replication protein N [Variovorax sp. PCZ-1]MBS7808335.1 primosomal replication protein N [Variovorax sp. PCZ-1]